MPVPTHHEALALLEIEGIASALAAQDAALKRAAVEVFACAPVSPGKVILIFAADVASVEESLAVARELVGSRLLDELFLPGIHADVLRALSGERRNPGSAALGVLELTSVAAAITAADAAVKAAEVQIGRLHPASGFGGKGYFTLWGEQFDVEAGVEAAAASVGARLLDQVVIPAPHDELGHAAFKRPWPLDPADG